MTPLPRWLLYCWAAAVGCVLVGLLGWMVWLAWPAGQGGDDGEGPADPYFLHPGLVPLRAGRSAESVVAVARRKTEVELTVAVTGLPDGVTCLPGRLPPGEGQAEVRLHWQASVDAGAFLGQVTLHLLAAGKALDSERLALQVTPFVRPRLHLPVGGLAVEVEPGQSKVLLVRVDAQGNADPWTIEIDSLPEGVSQRPLASVPAGTAGVELTAAVSAPTQERFATRLSLSADGVPADSAPLLVTVTPPSPPPVVGLSLPAGVRLPLGGRTQVVVQLRRGDYAGPVRLDVVKLPEGVRSAGGNIERGGNRGEFELWTDRRAGLGEKRLVVVARVDGKELGRQEWTFAVTPTVPAAGNGGAPGSLETEVDLKKMQGAWRVEIHQDGKPVKWGGRAKGKVIRIQKGVWTEYLVDDRGVERKTITYQIVLDTQKNPRWIDLQRTLGVQYLRGVYVFEGDGLRVRLAGGVGERLTSLDAPSSGATLLLMTRGRGGK